MPDDEISDCDVYEYCFHVTRIIVETVEVPVRLYGNFSRQQAQEIVQASIDRGRLDYDRKVRVDVNLDHVVPVWAVDRPAREVQPAQAP